MSVRFILMEQFVLERTDVGARERPNRQDRRSVAARRGEGARTQRASRRLRREGVCPRRAPGDEARAPPGGSSSSQ